MSILLTILGIILYIIAIILFANNMTYTYTSLFKKIIMCVFSIPIITATMTCKWKDPIIFWQMISAILIYVISITVLIIA